MSKRSQFTTRYGNDNANDLELPRIETARCPDCGGGLRYFKESQEDYYSRHALKKMEYFKDMQEHLIDDLCEMFPNTPIREYIEQKQQDMVRSIRLMMKGIRGELSFEEECELKQLLDK